MSEELMVPTVHLNGTGADELLDQATDAARAVDEAIAKVQSAWPNGRDYYTQGADTYQKAKEQWQSRVDRLKEVKTELYQISIAIFKQQER